MLIQQSQLSTVHNHAIKLPITIPSLALTSCVQCLSSILIYGTCNIILIVSNHRIKFKIFCLYHL